MPPFFWFANGFAYICGIVWLRINNETKGTSNGLIIFHAGHLFFGGFITKLFSLNPNVLGQNAKQFIYFTF
jgi:hypothetical protein